jgi:protein-disulfide isomerase
MGELPPLGPADAKVTIIEFSDYECPFCKRAEASVAQVKQTYGDKIRIAYRNYPLPFHQSARPAAQAAICANEQGKFWAMHDKLMEAKDLSAANLQQIATDTGLDRTKFDACVAEERNKDMIAMTSRPARPPASTARRRSSSTAACLDGRPAVREVPGDHRRGARRPRAERREPVSR